MPETLRLFLDRLDTPIGIMLIITDVEGNLRATDWDDHEPRMQTLFTRQYGKKGFTLEEAPAPPNVTCALRQYFAGEVTAIDALPVKTAGTPFQREVWKALRKIPCGTTTSYGELAAQIGRPAAVRAVGLANGANPVGLVVPCHRVIGSDGTLTGYGGGLHRKSWLLRHEAGSGHAPDRLF
jgi:methylated-DNA-[protein]-cysteine S-methyltransferase